LVTNRVADRIPGRRNSAGIWEQQQHRKSANKTHTLRRTSPPLTMHPLSTLLVVVLVLWQCVSASAQQMHGDVELFRHPSTAGTFRGRTVGDRFAAFEGERNAFACARV
jgi:hypothetical protein